MFFCTDISFSASFEIFNAFVLDVGNSGETGTGGALCIWEDILGVLEIELGSPGEYFLCDLLLYSLGTMMSSEDLVRMLGLGDGSCW